VAGARCSRDVLYGWSQLAKLRRVVIGAKWPRLRRIMVAPNAKGIEVYVWYQLMDG
jgi:hypothetical protein